MGLHVSSLTPGSVQISFDLIYQVSLEKTFVFDQYARRFFRNFFFSHVSVEDPVLRLRSVCSSFSFLNSIKLFSVSSSYIVVSSFLALF
jgi:hypothetical protein